MSDAGTDSKIALILMGLVYVSIMALIVYAWWKQRRVLKLENENLMKELELERARNELGVNSATLSELVDAANESNRRRLSTGHDPKKG